MTNLDLDNVVTIAGGTATVGGAKQLDTQTEAALTKLASDVKDLGKAPANSQMNQLMTVMMSKMMQRYLLQRPFSSRCSDVWQPQTPLLHV